MKKIILFLGVGTLAITFAGCGNNGNSISSNAVRQNINNEFSQKYPSARNVKWENEGEYRVAEFINNDMETSAWFGSDGVWYMSETDLPYHALPQKVRDSFKASEYASWKIEDIDMLERKDNDVIYIVEVEQYDREIDLYYTAEGILIKAVADNGKNNYDDYLIQNFPADITKFIEKKYPQAGIIEIEHDEGRIEVDIIHNNIGKEVVFDTNNQWLYTTWDVSIQSLPKAVMNRINTQYAGYHIDDADFIEAPKGNYYLLEIEKGHNEINIKMDEQGNLY